MGNVRAVSIPPGTAVFHAGETCRSYLIVLESSVRTVVGLGILSLAFIGPQTDWGYLGLVPLATGLIGWCPAYMPFGVITCKTS